MAITENDYRGAADLTGDAAFSTTFVDDATTISESEFDTNVGADMGMSWRNALVAIHKFFRGAAAALSGTFSAGAAAEAVALRFGATVTEGLEVRVIDETIDCATASSNFDLTQGLPSQAVILSVQANAQTAITGAGGATAFGVGISGDADKYGESPNLTLDTKISTMLATWTRLASTEDVRVYATDGAGTNTGTIGGSGEEIRVRIVFLALNDLDNA